MGGIWEVTGLWDKSSLCNWCSLRASPALTVCVNTGPGLHGDSTTNRNQCLPLILEALIEREIEKPAQAFLTHQGSSFPIGMLLALQ